MKNPYRIKTRYIDSMSLNKTSTRHQRRKVERMNKKDSLKNRWSAAQDWVDLHEDEAIKLGATGLLLFILGILGLCFNFLLVGGLVYFICLYLEVAFSWKIVFLFWLLFQILFKRPKLTIKVSDS